MKTYTAADRFTARTALRLIRQAQAGWQVRTSVTDHGLRYIEYKTPGSERGIWKWGGYLHCTYDVCKLANLPYSNS